MGRTTLGPPDASRMWPDSPEPVLPDGRPIPAPNCRLGCEPDDGAIDDVVVLDEVIVLDEAIKGL